MRIESVRFESFGSIVWRVRFRTNQGGGATNARKERLRKVTEIPATIACEAYLSSAARFSFIVEFLSYATATSTIRSRRNSSSSTKSSGDDASFLGSNRTSCGKTPSALTMSTRANTKNRIATRNSPRTNELSLLKISSNLKASPPQEKTANRKVYVPPPD